MRHYFQKLAYLALTLSCFAPPFAHALKFPLPLPGNDLVGNIESVITVKGDTLSSIGMKHDIGYYEMVEANPDQPKTKPIKPGTEIIIPARFILPTTRHGLVINLAELRVYWFPTDEQAVYTFPVGAGREGWNTPKALTRVINKKKDPVWIVPDSILAESKRAGKPIKKYWGPGPENPLGKYAIYFALPGIRMHGTIAPPSVGRRASHGCIRLLPDDIEFLYNHVPIGTPVHITHEQNKVGWEGPILYLETEVPFKEYDDGDNVDVAIAKATQHHPVIIDQQLVKQTLETEDGMPHAIGHDTSVSTIPEDADQFKGATPEESTNISENLANGTSALPAPPEPIKEN